MQTDDLFDMPFQEARIELLNRFAAEYYKVKVGEGGSIANGAELAGMDRANFKRMARWEHRRFGRFDDAGKG